MLPRGSLAIITADVGTVVAHAAVAFDVPEADLTGGGRTRPILDYRHTTMAAARLMGHSFPQIGRAFGMDHTTVMNACKRVEGDSRLAHRARALVASISDTPGSLF